MNDIILSPIRLSDLETLIQSCVTKAVAPLVGVTNPKDPEERLLSADEAATFLHITKGTLYVKVSKGELPGAMKQGKRLFFSSSELMTFMKEGRKKSNADIEEEADAYLLNRKGGSHNG